jgi:hypothetical protein
MHMVDELPPAEDLPDETFLALQRNIQLRDLADHTGWEQPVDVQQGGDPGVEEAGGARGHRVLVRPEGRQARALSPAPERLGVGRRRR